MNRTGVQIELLAALGRGEDAVRIVVNRIESRASVSLSDARKFLDRPVDASLPNDYRRASACVNEGRTLEEMAPRSPLARAVRELALLAHEWCNQSPPAPRQRGLLDRVRGR